LEINAASEEFFGIQISSLIVPFGLPAVTMKTTNNTFSCSSRLFVAHVYPPIGIYS